MKNLTLLFNDGDVKTWPKEYPDNRIECMKELVAVSAKENLMLAMSGNTLRITYCVLSEDGKIFATHEPQEKINFAN